MTCCVHCLLQVVVTYGAVMALNFLPTFGFLRIDGKGAMRDKRKRRTQVTEGKEL